MGWDGRRSGTGPEEGETPKRVGSLKSKGASGLDLGGLCMRRWGTGTRRPPLWALGSKHLSLSLPWGPDRPHRRPLPPPKSWL